MGFHEVETPRAYATCQGMPLACACATAACIRGDVALGGTSNPIHTQHRDIVFHRVAAAMDGELLVEAFDDLIGCL